MLRYQNPDTDYSTVIDHKGHVVGKMVNTVHEDSDGDPDFLVVDPGRFRACHYVPVDGSYTSVRGEVVVPFARWWVMCSPKADKGRVISRKTQTQLTAHYGSLYDWRRVTPDAML